VPSVKVDVLDHEHELCAAALQRLDEQRDRGSLEAVLSVFRQHFKHEEELLDQHLYAELPSAAGGFSADSSMRKSHFTDHTRMLGDISKALSNMQKGDKDAKLSQAFVKRVYKDFEEHADRYDGTYADRLSAVLAN